jgi:kanamycin kinase
MVIPLPDLPAPAKVVELAGGARLEPVWQNMLGGVTFRATETGGAGQAATDAAGEPVADSIRFIKYGPRNAEVSMAGEAERLAWAAPYTRVPRVVTHGSDATHEWLVTEGLRGRSAVDPRWVADPQTAVRAIGRGLRELHEALPVDACPFDWSVAVRMANARARGIRVPVALEDAPPIDRLVVCHGDACAPNSLLDEHGAVTGHVDLGALGVGDRWADIATAALSCDWNYGPGWQDTLVQAYGLSPDADRMSFYQALWTAV